MKEGMLHKPAIHEEELLSETLLGKFGLSDKTGYFDQSRLCIDGCQTLVDPLPKESDNSFSDIFGGKLVHGSLVVKERYGQFRVGQGNPLYFRDNVF